MDDRWCEIPISHPLSWDSDPTPCGCGKGFPPRVRARTDSRTSRPGDQALAAIAWAPMSFRQYAPSKWIFSTAA